MCLFCYANHMVVKKNKQSKESLCKYYLTQLRLQITEP